VLFRSRTASMLRNIGEHPAFLLILLGLAAVLFGGKRLPEAARGLGRSMRIFKSEVKQMHEEDEQDKAKRKSPLEGRVVDDTSASPAPTASPLDHPEPVRHPDGTRPGA